MARYGIKVEHALGVSIPNIKSVAKETGKDHALAGMLWDTKIHEARILASMVEEPAYLTEKQMDEWTEDFDSWDVCDQCCNNLFRKTAFVNKKIFEWTKRKKEFVKRAGFVLMAVTAVHGKDMKDKEFEKCFSIIKRESGDGRNYVKKAINWALRQIGKRNINLNKKAIKTAKEIGRTGSRSARWIASDALKELEKKAPDLRKR